MDILEQIDSLFEGNEHPLSSVDEASIASLLMKCAVEIKNLRMALANRKTHPYLETPIPHGSSLNNPVFHDILVSALQGSATTSATRHDMPPAKLVSMAFSIAREVGREVGKEVGNMANHS